MDATMKAKLREMVSDLSQMVYRASVAGDLTAARDLDGALAELRRVYWKHAG